MHESVLVTGGARRIGASIVRALASAGYRVVLHHFHSHAEAVALGEELRRDGAQIELLAADLAAGEAGRDIIAHARTLVGGPVWGVVNCASVFEFDRPPATRADVMEAATRVNLAAPVALANALAAQDDLDEGAVVNVLDQKIANLNPDFFSYTCSKVALEAATTMLAQALAPRIRVNAVSPGISLPSYDQTEQEYREVASQNLLHRPVELEDIGAAVRFLLETRSVTGLNLFVDCGQRFVTRDSDVMFSTRPDAMEERR